MDISDIRTVEDLDNFLERNILAVQDFTVEKVGRFDYRLVSNQEEKQYTDLSSLIVQLIIKVSEG